MAGSEHVRRGEVRLGARLSGRDTPVFAATVALLAIFWDAAVGHGLAWENDPYWTYWVTKTFLIFTVFGLGTAWLGIGLVRGAVVTLVHTLVLTVYYWTLSPVGLPSSPEWLDLEHTWISGVPIHFGVIYLGYLATLWLWRQRAIAESGDPAREAALALVAGVAIVVLAGGLASLAIWEWPGVTWFLVRLLITVPFLLLWLALAGRDWVAAVAGAITLAFVWATYAEYVGPLGLPETPLRILEQDPPPADVRWLDYRDTWLVSLPIYVLVMTVALVGVAAVRRREETGVRSRAFPLLPPVGIAAAVAGALLLANVWIESGGEEVTVSASGAARVEQGEWYGDDLVDGQGTLDLRAEDRVRKVTPLAPYDELALSASIEHRDGRTYDVEVEQPLVSHPAGLHTTWWGVGLDVWHHGESGIGTGRLPAVRSEVAVFGIGRVSVAGQPVAANVPVHVMTGEGEFGGRLELDVGDESALVPGLPDGHLRVVWPDYDGETGTTDAHLGRYAVGAVVLVLLLVFALAANLRAPGREVT